MNNGDEYLIIGVVVCSEYSNNRYLHLIIGNVQEFVGSYKNGFHVKEEIKLSLQVEICYTLLYNQIIKMSNQIIRIRIAWICSRMVCICSKCMVTYSRGHICA